QRRGGRSVGRLQQRAVVGVQKPGRIDAVHDEGEVDDAHPREGRLEHGEREDRRDAGDRAEGRVDQRNEDVGGDRGPGDAAVEGATQEVVLDVVDDERVLVVDEHLAAVAAVADGPERAVAEQLGPVALAAADGGERVEGVDVQPIELGQLQELPVEVGPVAVGGGRHGVLQAPDAAVGADNEPAGFVPGGGVEVDARARGGGNGGPGAAVPHERPVGGPGAALAGDDEEVRVAVGRLVRGPRLDGDHRGVPARARVRPALVGAAGLGAHGAPAARGPRVGVGVVGDRLGVHGAEPAFRALVHARQLGGVAGGGVGGDRVVQAGRRDLDHADLRPVQVHDATAPGDVLDAVWVAGAVPDGDAAGGGAELVGGRIDADVYRVGGGAGVVAQGEVDD